jgi:predicted nucleic acid-binding protein
MKPSIYIESSIPSYLTARASRDLVKAAHQQITQEWWERKGSFELFISEVVIQEISQGDQEAAQRRLDTVDKVSVLALEEDALVFARKLITAHLLPDKAQLDALHIAIAAYNGMDYLLTWNCKHIANAVMRPKIEQMCRTMGLVPPVICTPEELLEF